MKIFKFLLAVLSFLCVSCGSNKGKAQENVRLDATEILTPHSQAYQEIGLKKFDKLVAEITSVVSKVFSDQTAKGTVIVNLKIFKDKIREFEAITTTGFDPKKTDILFNEVNKLKVAKSKEFDVEFQLIYTINP